MQKLLRHPLSAAFPRMTAEDQDLLTEDIEKYGQRDAIVLFEGMIIDGWHRYQACLMLEIEPIFKELADNDPVAFVLSHNLHRRHLTGSQRAAAIVACSSWVKKGDNQHTTGGCEAIADPPPLTVSEMAKKADVSERTISQAKVAHTAGLGDKVVNGEITVAKAAAIAKPPKEKPVVSPSISPEPIIETIPKSDFEELTTRLDIVMADNAAIEAVFGANDQLAAAMDEIKSLNSQVAGLRSRISGLMQEKNDAIVMVKSCNVRIAKMQRELDAYRVGEVGL